jgi:uncharacterized protein
MSASSLYLGIGVLMALVLGSLVSRQRGKHKVMFGDGGVPALQQAIRAHGNFVEYAPIGLLALVALDALGEPPRLIHVLGIALIAGRLLHAWGISHSPGESPGRMIGIILTYLMLLASGVLLILAFFGAKL